MLWSQNQNRRHRNLLPQQNRNLNLMYGPQRNRCRNYLPFWNQNRIWNRNRNKVLTDTV